MKLKQWELVFIIIYVVAFYLLVISRSFQLSSDHYRSLRDLRPGWIANRLNDVSDPQWRNFRGNLPVLTTVLGIFMIVANALRRRYCLKDRGVAFLWILLSLIYIFYLHGACTLFLLSITTTNFFLVKALGRSKYYIPIHWTFNITILILNRKYEGYPFSLFGERWAFLDNHRGTFRWQICYNLVALRMISYGCDYHWSSKISHFDYEKHLKSCSTCSSGKHCYHALQETSLPCEKYSYSAYLCYLVYAPLYIAGPIISFNAFAKQLDMPQQNYSKGQTAWYGVRWLLNFFLIEGITHFFYYNAFAKSNLWRALSPLELFIVGYGVTLVTTNDILGAHFLIAFHNLVFLSHFVPCFILDTIVLLDLWIWNIVILHKSIFICLCLVEMPTIYQEVLNFMWLKFLLIWRYFRFWSLIGGIETPENMPRCINNCHDLESFWKSWHASFNKWLVRYMYIPLGGSRWKLFNVWAIFTFVALWHDLEWKLLSWAWLTCLFMIPEIVVKSTVNRCQVKNSTGRFVLRELSAVSGAITITCLMVANLVGYVIGPSGMRWFVSRLLQRDGLPVLGGIFISLYVGTKLMFHIRDAKQVSKKL